MKVILLLLLRSHKENIQDFFPLLMLDKGQLVGLKEILVCGVFTFSIIYYSMAKIFSVCAI